MDEIKFIEKSYHKVKNKFKELIDLTVKNSLNDEALIKGDSVITTYYEVYKRNINKIRERQQVK